MSQSVIANDPAAQSSQERLEGNRWFAPRVNRWLVWKESRQVAPLVFALWATMLFIMFASAFYGVPSYRRHVFLRQWLILFPGLFATGAGALLVGQERSSRTMEWFALLPISATRIWAAKLLAGLAGLTVMWLASFLILALVEGGGRSAFLWGSRSGSVAGSQFVSFLLHSIFILLCGYLTAWQIKNQFFAILAIVPLACLPILTSSLVSFFILEKGQRFLTPAQDSAVGLWAFAVLIPSVLVLGYRSAIRSLSPQRAPSIRLEKFVGAAEVVGQPVSVPKFGTQVAPLIWQSIHGNRAMLSLLSATLFATTALIWWCLSYPQKLSESHEDLRTALVGALFLLPLAVSWLGVCVFKNDGACERVKFLADRGVSPHKIWIARQAIPCVIVSNGLLLYLVLTVFAGTTERAALIPGVVIAVLMTLAIYSVSQLVSQITRPLTLAVVLAPMASLFAILWMSHCFESLGVWLGWIAVAVALPLPATWMMMPRFADSRALWKNWLVCAGVIMGMILIPLAPVIVKLRAADHMSRQTKSSLWKEALQIHSTARIGAYLSTNQITKPSLADPLDEIVNWSMRQQTQTPDELIPNLNRLRDAPDMPGSIDPYTQGSLFMRLQAERVRFENADDRKAAWNRFASWLDSASLLIRAQRNSRSWVDQELADQLEIWLAESLVSEAVAAHLDEGFLRTVAGRLPTKSERRKARREAVLFSWRRWVAEPNKWELGHQLGVVRVLDVLKGEPSGLVASLENTRAEAIVDTAISALQNPDALDWRERMHRLLGRPPGKFETGPYGDQLRSVPAISLLRGYRVNQPCRFWGLPWEDAVEQLVSNARNTDPPPEERSETVAAPEEEPASEEKTNE